MKMIFHTQQPAVWQEAVRKVPMAASFGRPPPQCTVLESITNTCPGVAGNLTQTQGFGFPRWLCRNKDQSGCSLDGAHQPALLVQGSRTTKTENALPTPLFDRGTSRCSACRIGLFVRTTPQSFNRRLNRPVRFCMLPRICKPSRCTRRRLPVLRSSIRFLITAYAAWRDVDPCVERKGRCWLVRVCVKHHHHPFEYVVPMHPFIVYLT